MNLKMLRILYEEWNAPEIQSQLENLENIKYTITKQSIHLQKFKSLEISERMDF